MYHLNFRCTTYGDQWFYTAGEGFAKTKKSQKIPKKSLIRVLKCLGKKVDVKRNKLSNRCQGWIGLGGREIQIIVSVSF